MFIIIEIQKDANGNVATLITQQSNRDQADSTYHTILASAAVSSLPEHGAVMLTSDCGFIMGQCYRHGAIEE